MKCSHVVPAIVFALMMGRPAASQSVRSLADLESPVLSDARPPDLTLTAVFQQPTPQPPPAVESNSSDADASKDEYRTVVKSLAMHRHQYVHCKLKNGKVLTGLIRDLSWHGFSLHTNALGGPYIRYEDLAEQPRPVPAVGTRLKQGAQWAGFGVLIAAAIPLLVVLAPLALTGILPDC